MIPDKVYIDIIDMDSGYMMAPSFENNGGAEYIRKDALLEWAEEYLSLKIYDTKREVMEDLIDKLNSL